MLKNKLQIFLITYNRKTKLQATLDSLLNSPVANYDITVLDNASTDGTSELLDDYAKKHKNITHIRHNVNIGGNANICRAFEMAASCGKDYAWVLCDDDTYDFSSWNDVETAIKNDVDAILVERKIDFPENNKLPYIINTMAFLPSTIYKTKNITSQVIQNMYVNLYTSFPHLALGCSLVNKHANISVLDKRIIYQNVFMDFHKGTNEEIHHRQKNVNLFSGYINSYQMIHDKKLRRDCCDVLWLGKSFFHSMRAFWKTNGLYRYNVSDVWNSISLRQKLLFVFAGVFVSVKYIFAIDSKYITLFGFRIKKPSNIKDLFVSGGGALKTDFYPITPLNLNFNLGGIR